MENKYLLLTITLLSIAAMSNMQADLSSSLSGILDKAKAKIKKEAPGLINKGKEAACKKLCEQCQASVAKDKAAAQAAKSV